MKRFVSLAALDMFESSSPVVVIRGPSRTLFSAFQIS